MSSPLALSSRLPRSGNAALASGALVQLAVGVEFVLAGLSKLVDPDYPQQFRGFVSSSPGATGGPLAGITQAIVAPNAELFAQVSRLVELGAGALLMLTALEVLRRRLSGGLGAQHAYEPLVALVGASAALVLGGMSLTIFLLEGLPLPSVNPAYAFGSPIAVELLLVPLALAIAGLEFGRFRALRANR
jgi:hypothetical protein